MIRRPTINIIQLREATLDKPGFVITFALELEFSSWLLRSDKSCLSWAYDNATTGLPSSASETWLAVEKLLFRFEFEPKFILALGWLGGYPCS